MRESYASYKTHGICYDLKTKQSFSDEVCGVQLHNVLLN